MLRLDAPRVVAILGAGLVMVVTGPPGGDAREPGRADPVGVPGARPVPEELSASTISEPSRLAGADESGRALLRNAPAAMPSQSGIEPTLVEDPAALARFTVPVDRFAIDPTSGEVVRAPLAFDGQPALVALVASWCAPCAAELPELSALAERAGLRLVLVSLDDVGGPESLRALIEDLFVRAEPTSRALPPAELRADPDGVWLLATGPLLMAGDPDALPQSLLFDGDGALLALVQGALDRAVVARFEGHLAGRLR